MVAILSRPHCVNNGLCGIVGVITCVCEFSNDSVAENSIMRINEYEIALCNKFALFMPQMYSLKAWEMRYERKKHIEALVVHYGISNTIVLEIP